MGKKVTIKDVASHANISITQVSRALNGYSDVSDSTRKKVIQAASELGFVPNKGARSLASKRQTEITVLLLNFNTKVSENVLSILNGINFEADKVKMQVRVDFLTNSITNSNTLDEYIIQNAIVNPIIVGLNEAHPYFDEILSPGFPHRCYITDNNFEKDNIINVNVDDLSGISQVIDHFVDNKYTRVGIVGGDFESYVNTTRRDITLKLLKDNNISHVYITGNYDSELARMNTLESVDLLKDLDAIFCFSDIMALGVTSALNQLNLHIPVIGFDGLDIGDFVYPKISSVHQSFMDKGAKIAKSILSEEADNNDIVVEAKLVIKNNN